MPTAERYLKPSDLPAEIPVFPLRGAILLPRASLPLNVFEPRYLTIATLAIQLLDGRIVLAGLAGTLLVSEDQGRNFELRAQADRAGIAKVLQADDDALILIGEMGVKRLPLAGLGGEVAP